MLKKSILRWLPALAVMVIIFSFSSLPDKVLPHFGPPDVIVKKASHMVGYGLLALAYWYALRYEKRRWWMAISLAILYAMTDEFHQSFVSGRHPSWVDVLVFDGGGAAIGLILATWWRIKRQSPINRE